MDEQKVAELRANFAELTRYLAEQHEVILGLSRVIGAVRQTLQDDQNLSEKYKAHLEALEAADNTATSRFLNASVKTMLKHLSQW